MAVRPGKPGANPMTDQIEGALEAAHKALQTVEEAWAEDADTLASAAMASDPRGARLHIAWPDRLNDLRQAFHLVEGLLDDHREHGTYSNDGWAKLTPETQASLLIKANERLRAGWQDAEAQIPVPKAKLADTSGM